MVARSAPDSSRASKEHCPLAADWLAAGAKDWLVRQRLVSMPAGCKGLPGDGEPQSRRRRRRLDGCAKWPPSRRAEGAIEAERRGGDLEPGAYVLHFQSDFSLIPARPANPHERSNTVAGSGTAGVSAMLNGAPVYESKPFSPNVLSHKSTGRSYK